MNLPRYTGKHFSPLHLVSVVQKCCMTMDQSPSYRSFAISAVQQIMPKNKRALLRTH